MTDIKQMATEALVEDLLVLRARYSNKNWKPSSTVLGMIENLLGVVDPTGETTRAMEAKVDRMRVGLAGVMAEQGK